MSDPLNIEVVIFGGGAAGLWLLDDLRRRGADAILLESSALGSGQTIASQGIIHGGLKYTLSGLFTPAARAIRDMPLIWRRCLAGEQEPDLSRCRLRCEFCYLWRTESIGSRLAMIGARAGLRVRPTAIEPNARPAALAHVPGTLARLDEQVIDPASMLETLAARNRSRLLKIDSESGLELIRGGSTLALVRLINPDTGEPVDLRPRNVVFLAGAGNERLRTMAGLNVETSKRHDVQTSKRPGTLPWGTAEHNVQIEPRLRREVSVSLALDVWTFGRLDVSMQRRPLHMVMARGEQSQLPELNGHCVDGANTRLTITSAIDFADRRIWQIGGRVAEIGTGMDRRELIEHAIDEVRRTIPGLDLSGVSWSTYLVDRAEGAGGGVRPEDVTVIEEGNIVTGWPTKLALVPKLVEEVSKRINVQTSRVPNVQIERQRRIAAKPRSHLDFWTLGLLDVFANWPRPAVALPPWETEQEWVVDH